MNRIRFAAIGAALASLTAVGQLAAQDAEHYGPGGFIGLSLVAADPVGEWSQLVDQGWGFDISGGIPAAAEGGIRLRGDFGVVVYGIEHVDYCTFGCRVSSGVTTMNSVLYLGFGPEFVIGSGPVQPYVHGTAGLSFFVTSSSVDGYDDHGSTPSTTNYSDTVIGWKVGGGVRMRVGGQRRPVYLDVGLQRHRNGVASYLTEGDIVDQPDGSVILYPNESEADLVTLRVGVSFTIR